MPTTLTAPEPLVAAAQHEPYRWTADEYERAFEAGIFTEDSKVELLDGIITRKMGNGPIHDFILRHLLVLFIQRLAYRHAVGSQSTVNPGPRSRPEPGVWVSRRSEPAHRDRIVDHSDLLLVVEVSDTTLDRDRNVKLPIYAAASIPEYWIVDVTAEVLYRLTEPDGVRAYAKEEAFAKTDTLVHDLLGEVVLERIFG